MEVSITIFPLNKNDFLFCREGPGKKLNYVANGVLVYGLLSSFEIRTVSDWKVVDPDAAKVFQ